MKVHSLFQSINGEVTNSVQGSVCTFIRLQGCSMLCGFCDTPDSQNHFKGIEMFARQIDDLVYRQLVSTKHVTITGGEPLLQEQELLELCTLLWPLYRITLETNGALPVPKDIRAMITSVVMDIKPMSADIQMNFDKYWTNANQFACDLTSSDWVKYPIINKEDFGRAIASKNLIKKGSPKSLPGFAFSAVYPLTPKILYDWIIERKEGDVVLNVQIHKLIGVA